MESQTPQEIMEGNWRSDLGKITDKVKSKLTRSNKTDKKDREIETAEGKLQEKIDRAFSPTNLREMVALPSVIMLQSTGHDFWNLSSEEKDIMASGASEVARIFIKTDPKWAVLGIAMINIGMIYTSRILMEIEERRKEREAGAGKK